MSMIARGFIASANRYAGGSSMETKCNKGALNDVKSGVEPASGVENAVRSFEANIAKLVYPPLIMDLHSMFGSTYTMTILLHVTQGSDSFQPTSCQQRRQ